MNQQNNLLMMTGAQTTAVMYVGPKSTKLDTVSGFKPQMSFKRNVPTETPLMVAQALLSFDCFIPATEESIEAAKAAEDWAKEQAEKEAAEAEAARLEELELQKTVIEVDGENIDVLKLNFGQIETLCLAQEIDVKREDGEAKELLAVRVRKAYEEQQAE